MIKFYKDLVGIKTENAQPFFTNKKQKLEPGTYEIGFFYVVSCRKKNADVLDVFDLAVMCDMKTKHIFTTSSHDVINYLHYAYLVDASAPLKLVVKKGDSV